MKNTKRFLAALAAAAMTAALFAGCGSTPAADTTAAAEGDTTAAEGDTAAADTSEKISIAVTGGSEDTMVLNTAACGTLNGLSADRHAFEGLYKLDSTGTPVLGQAASVEQSDDGLTWTFTLRDDITWSDGQTVTAQDFIYGFDNLVATADDYCSLLSDVASSWTAPDDKTVVITLNGPCGFLPSILAFPSTYPVRQDYVEQYGDAYATDPEKAVYNGPYAVTAWEHESSLTLTLRDDYYDAANIQVGTIDWKLVSEESTALAMFESKEIIYSDMCPDEEAARMEGNGLFYTAGNNNYCAMFNTVSGNEVLQDANVRRALGLAIDRERIISIRDMNDELGVTLACSGYTNADGTDFTDYAQHWYGDDDYEANCEEAKQLLADAGYADGEGFPALTYIVNNDSRKEIAEAIVNDWKEVLGIDTITVQKSENFYADRSSGAYDIAYFGWYMDYTDLSNMFGTMVTGANNAGYSSEDYDAAYQAAISTSDEAEQWENYAKCEEILAQDMPVAVILHSMNNYLYNDTDYAGLVYSCGNFVFTYVTAK